ncbi:hypothetical protein VP01_1386g8 [Puccinia sorghi]|uniref:DDE Tnp4 domain-containing protein n=1 Tax=Puccinia sorghi TaxID=27349 RepID=A0A0L6VN56_9BASI|nr:hypothetical protein VP01_1386g8 [Puccinia sorghi]
MYIFFWIGEGQVKIDNHPCIMAILALSPRIITWPTSQESWACLQYRERNSRQGIRPLFQIFSLLDQWSEIKQSFEARHKIPQIVGAIDGTHVPVAIPAHDNLKGVWLMAEAILVCGGGPGSMHDARVFRCSKLGQSLRADSTTPPMIPHGTFLVGDDGPSNQWFNFIQSSRWIVLEQAFGRLKNRPETHIFACMILHNILNCRGTLYLHDWDTCSDKEVIFVELPLPEPDALPRNLLVDGGHKVSMMTKREIIQDMLYVPPQGTIS